jgi:hypothetical protein
VTDTQAPEVLIQVVPGVQGWRLDNVSASFGVTLTAEAGALLSKASAGATFDVTVTYKRAPDDRDRPDPQ